MQSERKGLQLRRNGFGLNEGITVSDVCLSDALILSGFRGGGSGASDAAITIPLVPFNCICQCT